MQSCPRSGPRSQLDVKQGAFDKRSADVLVNELTAAGVHPKMVRVLSSWLAPRTARVVLNGRASHEIHLVDMVCQGTALGPRRPSCRVGRPSCGEAL
eukprot:15473794-Alexandrium_andersonii.AAC.1